MEGISIKLPAALGSALASEARRRNVTQSAIVREALERSLLANQQGEGQTTCADLVGDLAGSIKSGRPDLATNKAHLESAVLTDFRRGPKRRR